MEETQHTRRSFLQMSGLASLGLCLPSAWLQERTHMQNKNLYRLYVGTYTKGKSEGIYVYNLNILTGELTLENTTKVTDNPSFVVIDPQKRFLYAVNETMSYEGEKSGYVSAFAIEGKTGKLTPINKQPSLGGAPCYITMDKGGKHVLIANYMGGNVAVYPVGPDGSLGKVSHTQKHTGSSINTKRQEAPHAHCMVLDAGNKYAFSADLGADKIFIYRYDAATGKLTPNQPASVATKPGAGPRHFTFHPNGKYAFVINELNSTLTSFAYDASAGSLKEIDTQSTLPKEFTGENFCADIHLSPDGRFVYGSNRGHNSIVVFGVDQSSGKLTYIENVSTGGEWPRNFTLDPSGKILLVANQNTDNIVSFTIDTKTGKLKATGKEVQVPSPVCLQIVSA